MSSAETSPRRISDQRVAGLDPLSQWVYVSSQGPDITTLENNIHCHRDAKRWKGHAACVIAGGETAAQEEIAVASGDASRSMCDAHRGNFHLAQLRLICGALGIESMALEEIESKLLECASVFHGDGKPPAGTSDASTATSDDIDPLAASELEQQTELSETSSCDPPMLEEYFDKASEVFVIKERIAELEQQTAETALQNPESSGHAVPEPQSEANRNHEKLVEALVIAESELHELREACVRQGIEPEHKRYRRISEPTKKPNFHFLDFRDALATPIRIVKDAVIATES